MTVAVEIGGVADQVREQGWALVRKYISPSEVATLNRAVRAAVSSKGRVAECQYYFDKEADSPPRLARIERITDAAPILGTSGLVERMRRIAQQCLGTDVVLFKDKLNLRYPNSAGYAPHQDASRWDRFADRFISIGVFLSESSPSRGGFEFAVSGRVRHRLSDETGDLDAGQFAGMPRSSVLANAGDALFIDGQAPHRTFQNCSDDILYHLLFTFVSGQDESRREAYYSEQASQFDSVRVGNVFLFPSRPV